MGYVWYDMLIMCYTICWAIKKYDMPCDLMWYAVRRYNEDTYTKTIIFV